MDYNWQKCDDSEGYKWLPNHMASRVLSPMAYVQEINQADVISQTLNENKIVKSLYLIRLNKMLP